MNAHFPARGWPDVIDAMTSWHFKDTEKAWQLISFVLSAAGRPFSYAPGPLGSGLGFMPSLAHTFPSIPLSASNENESVT